MRLLYGHDAAVAAWVQAGLGHERDFGQCAAIGVIDDKGEPVAGVVYHDYQPEYSTIQLSIYTVTPRWAQRGIISGLLAYPFNQLGVRKCWTSSQQKNERIIRFLKGIGFKQEAVLKNHYGKDNAVICRMFNRHYQERWGKHG